MPTRSIVWQKNNKYFLIKIFLILFFYIFRFFFLFTRSCRLCTRVHYLIVLLVLKIFILFFVKNWNFRQKLKFLWKLNFSSKIEIFVKIEIFIKYFSKIEMFVKYLSKAKFSSKIEISFKNVLKVRSSHGRTSAAHGKLFPTL